MNQKTDVPNLSLYHYQACPFCAVTRQVMSDYDLDIEQRDILRNSNHRNELTQGGGKLQVPCLRIDFEDGDTEWMYESAQIIEYIGVLAGQVSYAEAS